MPRSTIETLETRRLLSVALKTNGTLQINATSGNDVIRLGFDDTFVNTVAVTLNGQQKLFQARDVRRINVEALTGHDRIYVDRSLSALGAIKLNIDAGRGNDRVTIESIGNVNTIVLLGDGNDTLTFLRGDAFGGNGNDHIVGSSATKISGGSGRDRLFGGWVRGDGGDDFIQGTNDPDMLFGGNGNDTLTGGDGQDSLYGGEGDDKYSTGENEIKEDRSAGTYLGANILLTGGALNSRSFSGSNIGDAGATIIANGGVTMTGTSFSNYGAGTNGAGTIGAPSITATGTLNSSTAIAYIDDSILLTGYNAGTTNLTQRPDLTDKQIKKIKPGIVSIDESWEVTRVGTEGKIIWLKVRGDASQRYIELDTSIERSDGKTVDPSKYPAGVPERKLKVSFMAIHRDSVLAIGGLTGESAVPIAPSYQNTSAAVFASSAKIRLMKDWSDAHSVNDKVPLQPGVNPHGRRGVIVDDGIIWFDDVDRPYFQKIDL